MCVTTGCVYKIEDIKELSSAVLNSCGPGEVGTAGTVVDSMMWGPWLAL